MPPVFFPKVDTPLYYLANTPLKLTENNMHNYKYMALSAKMVWMIKNEKQISMVIPAYNEGKFLRQCLESLAKQTVMPYEVIVVNNNSTDDTAQVAGEFAFCTVIQEPRQGSSFACFTGFSRASGEVIGRIDADNILPPDWCEKMLASLERHQASAVVGVCTFYNVRCSKLFEIFHSMIYHRLQPAIAGTQILWGTNMGITSAAWQSIEKECVSLPQVDEDICISLLLGSRNQKIVWDKNLRLTTSFRQIDMSFPQVKSYLRTWVANYVVVNELSKSRYIALLEHALVGMALVLGPIMKLFRK